LAARRAALEAAGGYAIPAPQTPWQELHRQITGQYPGGAVIEAAVPYQRIAQTRGLPRDSH
jgi:dihydroxy-acid dehydratase